jgi:putative hemolysin
MFLAGRNSRLFQVASHLSQTLRLSLLFHEVRNKIGSAVEVRIGLPVPYDQLSRMGDRKALIAYLRSATYELGVGDGSTRPDPRLRLRAKGAPLRRIALRLRRRGSRDAPVA